MSGEDAVLVLEDGWVMRGRGFGARATSFGEMVFNTGMTGYQETLTDPSYHRQIVAMTAPHIGNTGINDDDHESRRIWVAGFVVREPARIASNWRSLRSLDDELEAQAVAGIAITGTRALTRHLRDKGAMRAAISTVQPDVADPARLLDAVRASPSMAGADLAREVSTQQPYVVRPPRGTATRYRVAAVDLGIKSMTPRRMAERGCEVHVLPATVSAAQILAVQPDGVFYSNGPGDPAAADYAVESMRGVLAEGLPVFGICLGSQILGRALGLDTYKLRFGHRGINQPVMDLHTGRVQITSHNHGFAVTPPTSPGGEDDAGGKKEALGSSEVGETRRAAGVADGKGGTGWADAKGGTHWADANGGTGWADGNGEADEGRGVGAGWAGGPREPAAQGPAGPAVVRRAQPFGTSFGSAEVTHLCLNDGVVEGLRLLKRPAFSVQYHPEAAPGTHDAAGEFDRFIALMAGGR